MTYNASPLFSLLIGCIKIELSYIVWDIWTKLVNHLIQGVFSLPDGVISTDRVVYVGIQILLIMLVKRNLQQIIMVSF